MSSEDNYYMQSGDWQTLGVYDLFAFHMTASINMNEMHITGTTV